MELATLDMIVTRKDAKTNHSIDHFQEQGEADKLLKEKADYTDYYEYIATSKTIRPICVTEGVDLETMTWLRKILWYFGTFLKCLSLIILSVRTDRLVDRHYLKHHWLHYGGILAMALLAWTPQLIHILGTYGILERGIFKLDHLPAFIICTAALFFYILSVSFFFKVAKPLMLAQLGKATTLRIWEYFVSFCWLVQTHGFWVLTITPPVLVNELEVIPTWLTTSVGVGLIATGIAAKMAAIYGTGFNTYYWYDMVVDIPNAYFVEFGIYRFVGSPTYTLGRGSSFGVALLHRSLPMMVAGVLDLALINIFDQLVEQAFVKEMYLKPNTQEVATGETQMDV